MSNDLNLKEGKRYTGVCHPLFRFRAPDQIHNIVQGCYFDGKHYFVAMVTKDSEGYEKTRITVYDQTGTVIRASDPLDLDHANCLTYHSGKNQLIVSHCQSPDKHYNRYSAVDLDTMQIVCTEDKPAPFFSMAYSAEKDMYVSGEWGGETLDYWDGNMELVKSCAVEQPKSLSQGVFADGEYCYFVRSSRNGVSAEIRVYNWEGEMKFQIPLQIEDMIEPENLNIVDGVGYILCNTWPKDDTSVGNAYRLELVEAE